MRVKRLLSFFAVGTMFFAASMVNAVNTVVYVKAGGTGDGASWANAAGNLNTVTGSLKAGCNTDIWVAEGSYQLSGKISLSTTVNMYGGFAGTEQNLSERNQSKKSTIVGGAYGTLDAVAEKDAAKATVIDGFIFTGANCPTLPANTYGNIYVFNNRNISNCIFTGNIFFKNSACGVENATISNCLIYKNETPGNSAAIALAGTSKAINCTVVNNSGANGGLRVSGSSKVYNSIVWGNAPKQGYMDAATAEFVNSAIETPNGFATQPVFTNCKELNAINDNVAGPLFADVAMGDYMLGTASPCLNAGNNEYVAGLEKDVLGNNRIVDNVVDMGACEGSKAVVVKGKIVYVKSGANGDGTSWNAAFGDINQAISSLSDGCGQDLWVGVGEYQTNARLVLPTTVNMYGGFTGTETNLNQRDLTKKSVIKGGEYSMLKANAGSPETPTYIDGFVFTGTNVIASNAAQAGISGNIHLEAFRHIRNCIVKDNTYQKCGAIFANNGAKIINCLVCNNVTTVASAAVTLSNGGELINSTVAKNIGGKSATGETNNWGGLRINANCKIYNSIVWGNTKMIKDKDGSFIQIPYQVRVDVANKGSFKNCAIQGQLTGGDISNAVPEEMLNPIYLSEDNAHAEGPNFVNAESDYSLKAISPCIDKGDNSLAEGITNDLAGNARIVNNIIDMGAYEQSKSTGIDYNAIDEKRTLCFPNPVVDYLTITSSEAERAEIYTQAGTLILQSTVTSGEQLDLSSLATGYYILVVYTSGNSSHMPILKK